MQKYWIEEWPQMWIVEDTTQGYPRASSSFPIVLLTCCS